MILATELRTAPDSAAGEQLKELFATFPFVSDADHCAAVAAIIASLLRRSLPAAPMIRVTAPTPGTGKSLLTEAIARITLGQQAGMLALGEDEAGERRK